jgi:hypothetical protein
MARKVAHKKQHDESQGSGEGPLTTSMSSFVSDMLRFTEGKLSVDELLERNPTDESDQETAVIIRKCGRRSILN